MKNKRVIIGLAASGFFIYLIIWIPQFGSLLRGELNIHQALFGKPRIDFEHLMRVFSEIRGFPLILSFLIAPLHVLVRSRRWVVMLKPIGRLKWFDSFSIVMISYLSNAVLPLRIGEIVRGVLVSRRIGISNSSGLGSVVLDRILDVLALIVLIILTGFMFEFPEELTNAAKFMKIGAVGMALIFVALIVFMRSLKKLIDRLTALFPRKIGKNIREIVFQFISGFKALKKPHNYFEIIIETFLIWFLFATQVFLILMAFGFTEDYPRIAANPLMVSLVILISSAIALAVPAAPSGIGTFHAAIIFALTFFNVEAAEAAGFALVIHAVTILYYLFIGVPFMWREGMKLSGLKKLSAGVEGTG